MLNFAELCISGISYLSGSQAVLGLTATACELITVCVYTHACVCTFLSRPVKMTAFSVERELTQTLLKRSQDWANANDPAALCLVIPDLLC